MLGFGFRVSSSPIKQLVQRKETCPPADWPQRHWEAICFTDPSCRLLCYLILRLFLSKMSKTKGLSPNCTTELVPKLNIYRMRHEGWYWPYSKLSMSFSRLMCKKGFRVLGFRIHQGPRGKGFRIQGQAILAFARVLMRAAWTAVKPGRARGVKKGVLAPSLNHKASGCEILNSGVGL